MEIIFASLLGLVVGVLIGLLPGFGSSTSLVLLSPLLINQSLFFCVCFYVTSTTISQYFGSVTTMSLRVPGENTSFPILDALDGKNTPKDLYFLTSIGSFISSLLAILLVLLFYHTLFYTTFYLKTWISLLFGSIGAVLCIYFSNKKIWISALLFSFGWIISKIGFDSSTNTTFLTFNSIYLYGGIPTLAVLAGLYTLPNVLKISDIKVVNKEEIYSDSLIVSISKTKSYLSCILLSSITGFISGLIPYLGNTTSSYISYYVDKKFKHSNYRSNIVAAESANNSANISVLIPLLLLGVAITPSELILLEILASGYHTLSWINLKGITNYLIFSIILTNFVAFYISWRMADLFSKIIANYQNIISYCVLMLTFFSILYVGSKYDQTFYYLIVLLIFGLLGFFLRNISFIPFIYSFLLQNNLEPLIYRFFKLYF